jgi:hypothetical protein
MPKKVQFRRGTGTQNDAFTGEEGEITMNTSNNSIRIHDGSTAGGHEMMKVDLSNMEDGSSLDGGSY